MILIIVWAISIHVPAWGTTTMTNTLTSQNIFQSTFPRGERHALGGNGMVTKIFQSTFPRGERHCNGSLHSHCTGFQSTFPRGERQQILTIFRLYFCIGITNLHFTSLLLSEFFILFISFVRFFKFFMVRVSLGFSVCF